MKSYQIILKIIINLDRVEIKIHIYELNENLYYNDQSLLLQKFLT